MKIDMGYIFRDMDDKEIKIAGKVQTFAVIACQALLNLPENTNPSGNEKVIRYNLAMRVHNNGVTEFNLDELKLLKDLIGQAFTPLIVGQAWELLEPKGGKDGTT